MKWKRQQWQVSLNWHCNKCAIFMVESHNTLNLKRSSSSHTILHILKWTNRSVVNTYTSLCNCAKQNTQSETKPSKRRWQYVHTGTSLSLISCHSKERHRLIYVPWRSLLLCRIMIRSLSLLQWRWIFILIRSNITFLLFNVISNNPFNSLFSPM